MVTTAKEQILNHRLLAATRGRVWGITQIGGHDASGGTLAGEITTVMPYGVIGDDALAEPLENPVDRRLGVRGNENDCILVLMNETVDDLEVSEEIDGV